MTLWTTVAQIAVVVGVMVVVAAAVVIRRPRTALHRATDRIADRADAPYFVLLVAVLAVNTAARRYGPDVSWLIGLNVTGYIYAIEGGFVAWLQTFATPAVTAYLSFMYVYGYVFLLVFPLVAYAGLDEDRPLRETTVAYSVNYAVGLVCYLLFVAYGPRNLIPELVEPLLYATWPESQFLTSEVNQNTNVFPSLHASLSLTVLLLAYRTRGRYPRWLPIAGLFAASIALSTMYLGIHWGLDVVAGGLLAVLSVATATRLDLDVHHWRAGVAAALTRRP